MTLTTLKMDAPTLKNNKMVKLNQEYLTGVTDLILHLMNEKNFSVKEIQMIDGGKKAMITLHYFSFPWENDFSFGVDQDTDFKGLETYIQATVEKAEAWAESKTKERAIY
jgi:hypothetical protein